MHRAVSRAVTALLILVLIIMGGLLTALMLWPDEVSSDESTGNGTANADAEIPEEIELDEEVFNSIQVLIDLWADRRMSEAEPPAETEEQIIAEEAAAVPSEETPVTIAEAVSAAIEEEAVDEDILIQPIADESPETIKDEVTSSDNVINALNTLIERWKAEERGEEETEEENITELRPEEIEESMTALESEGMEASFYSTELDEIHIAAQGSDSLSDSSSQDLALPPIILPSPYIPVEAELPEEDPWADFYIQGEDDLLLEDGIYYMEYFVNNDSFGSIDVEIINGEVCISTEIISQDLKGVITEDAYNRIILPLEGEYTPLTYFDEMGVETAFDSDNYIIDLFFSIEDLPLRVISIANGGSRGRRMSIQAMSDAVPARKAAFSLTSRYSNSLSFSLYDYERFSWNYNLSVSNIARFLDVNLTFGYYLGIGKNRDFSFSFGSYLFQKDFTDKMLRLTWGNTSTSLLSPSGTPVGITIDKNFSYGDNVVRKNVQTTNLTLEKESLVEVINSGKTIYSATLEAGNYRLEDFILHTGLNSILVRVSPTDGSAVEEIFYEFSYSSALLHPGEVLYKFGLAFGRESLSSKQQKRDGAFGFNLFNKYIQYDVRNLSLSGNVNVGLTKSLTMNTTLAFSNNPKADHIWNPKVRGAFEFTHANRFGTARYNLNLNFNNLIDGIYTPQVYLRVSEQFSVGTKLLSSITLSGTYTSPEDILDNNERHTLLFSLGLSGRLGKAGYSLGGSAYIYTDEIEKSPYSFYASLSFSPFRRFSLSASINVNGNYNETPKISGRLYGSISFSKAGSSSVSISEGNSHASYSVSGGNTYFSITSNGPGYSTPLKGWGNLDNYSWNSSLSSSFSRFSMGVGLNGNYDASRLSGSLSVSTSSIFADGYFAIASAIPSNVLLIKQGGNLKGNDLEVGYAGYSSVEGLYKTFGTYLFTGVSSKRRTDLVLYSTPEEDSFGTSSSFPISIDSANGDTYVYKVTADELYTVSAIAEANGIIFANGSSPLYTITEENNTLILNNEDDAYIFTDENGRFIASDLKAGTYGFDMKNGDEWILFTFSINEDVTESTQMNLYKTTTGENTTILPEEYSSSVNLVFDKSITSDEFWEMLYPSFSEEIANE